MHMILFRCKGTDYKAQKFSVLVQHNAKAEQATVIAG